MKGVLTNTHRNEFEPNINKSHCQKISAWNRHRRDLGWLWHTIRGAFNELNSWSELNEIIKVLSNISFNWHNLLIFCDIWITWFITRTLYRNEGIWLNFVSTNLLASRPYVEAGPYGQFHYIKILLGHTYYVLTQFVRIFDSISYIETRPVSGERFSIQKSLKSNYIIIPNILSWTLNVVKH